MVESDTWVNGLSTGRWPNRARIGGEWVLPSRLIARLAIVLGAPAIVVRARNSVHTPSTTISLP
jgi:hypothetical protein